MIPKDGRCEEHGLYLYRTGFGWSCKLGCYYIDDPQKIKEGFIQQYKEELKDKINKIDSLFSLTYSKFYDKDAQIKGAEKMKEKILELLKEEYNV